MPSFYVVVKFWRSCIWRTIRTAHLNPCRCRIAIPTAVAVQGISGTSYAYEFANQVQGWYRGIVTLNKPDTGDQCVTGLTLEIRGLFIRSPGLNFQFPCTMLS